MVRKRWLVNWCARLRSFTFVSVRLRAAAQRFVYVHLQSQSPFGSSFWGFERDSSVKILVKHRAARAIQNDSSSQSTEYHVRDLFLAIIVIMTPLIDQFGDMRHSLHVLTSPCHTLVCPRPLHTSGVSLSNST